MQENVFETMGIGTDIEEVRRFENLNDRSFVALLKKSFTKSAGYLRGVPHGRDYER